jgi:hypothetical protein
MICRLCQKDMSYIDKGMNCDAAAGGRGADEAELVLGAVDGGDPTALKILELCRPLSDSWEI